MDRDLTSYLVPGTEPEIESLYRSLPAVAEDAVFGLEEEVAFLDLETTGLSADDRIVEIGALVARGPEVLRRFSTLVDPGKRLSETTPVLTGIRDEMLSGAPPIEDALPRLFDFLGQADVVAHNAGFDRFFLEMAGGARAKAISARWLDSLVLSRIVLPRMRSHRLAELAAAFGLGALPHRAAEDAGLLHRLWRVLLAGLDAMPPQVPKAAAEVLSSGGHPLARVLSRQAYGKTSSAMDLLAQRKTGARRVRRAPLVDALDAEIGGPDPDAAARQFEADGLIRRMYEDFEPRPGQETMAAAVSQTLLDGGRLAVEAGTGVGKSVAYLLPAALFALHNDVAVGVATKTNALLDQLAHRELPLLARALAADGLGKVRFVSLKGYEHYLCLRKLDRALGGSGRRDAMTPDALVGDEETSAAVAALLSWVCQSPQGDLDSVHLPWPPSSRAHSPARPRTACAPDAASIPTCATCTG